MKIFNDLINCILFLIILFITILQIIMYSLITIIVLIFALFLYMLEYVKDLNHAINPESLYQYKKHVATRRL